MVKNLKEMRQMHKEMADVSTCLDGSWMDEDSKKKLRQAKECLDQAGRKLDQAEKILAAVILEMETEDREIEDAILRSNGIRNL